MLSHTLAGAQREISDAWRVLARLGLVDTIFNHISFTVEDASGQTLLMNPSACMADELRPDLVRAFPVREYKSEEGDTLGVNPDGLRLHSLMHQARGSVGAVVHTHSVHAIAVSCSTTGLLPLSQTAVEFVDDVRIIEYDGVFRQHALSPETTRLATDGGVALLRHHGSLVVADSIAEAVYLTFYLEEACRIQVMTTAQGTDFSTLPKSIVAETAKKLRQNRPVVAAQLFEALRRQLPNTP